MCAAVRIQCGSALQVRRRVGQRSDGDLVGSHEDEVVGRVGDDVALGGRVVFDRARRVAEPTQTEAQDAVRSQRERKQLVVQPTVLPTHTTTHIRLYIVDQLATYRHKLVLTPTLYLGISEHTLVLTPIPTRPYRNEAFCKPAMSPVVRYRMSPVCR